MSLSSKADVWPFSPPAWPAAWFDAIRRWLAEQFGPDGSVDSPSPCSAPWLADEHVIECIASVLPSDRD
jgi:hypothetical protein